MPVALLEVLEGLPAPLAMLVLALVLTVAVSLAVVGTTQLARRLVDRKWPPNQALNPTELLWAESGGHVQRTFKGLDLTLARELATQMSERKLAAGAFLFHEGDVATHYYVLAKGKVEAVQEAPERVLRSYSPGESFGEVAILERTARTAAVRAVTDSVVLALAAEDFVAAATLSASEGADFRSVVDAYVAADQAHVEGAAAQGVPATPPGPQPPSPAPAVAPAPAPAVAPAPAPPVAPVAAVAEAEVRAPEPAEPTGWSASHLVPAGGLPLWVGPEHDGPAPTTLPARTELAVTGTEGTSARVLLADGSSGWVDRRLLIPRRGPRSDA